MNDDLVKTICLEWVAKGDGDKCFWGKLDSFSSKQELTANMVLEHIDDLDAKIAKAIFALEAAMIAIKPEEIDIMKKQEAYRIAVTLLELTEGK